VPFCRTQECPAPARAMISSEKGNWQGIMQRTTSLQCARLLGGLGFGLCLAVGLAQGLEVGSVLERAVWAMLCAGVAGLALGRLLAEVLNTSNKFQQVNTQLPASYPEEEIATEE